MVRKFFLAGLALFNLTFGATLTELLNSVQDTITNYEFSGKALEQPYVYTKMKLYYKYGRIYASYGIEKPAVKLLDLAACSGAPLDCRPYLYFETNISLTTYRYLRKYRPILLARTEAVYDAYANWWIKKRTALLPSIYKSFKNLENILRYDFAKYWKAFLEGAPKPIYFVIPRSYGWKDRFLLAMLSSAYQLGWVKRITFYGYRGDYISLLEEGLIKGIRFVPSEKYPYLDLIEVY